MSKLKILIVILLLIFLIFPVALITQTLKSPKKTESSNQFASNVQTGLTTATNYFSETALGLRFGVGVDMAVSKLFMLSVGAGYFLVSDFENRIGSEKEYSSPELSLSFGIVFGREEN